MKASKSHINPFIGLLISLLFLTSISKAQLPTEDRFQQAIQYYQAKDYHAAILQFNRMLSVDSSQARVFIMLSSSYMQLKDWNRASQYAQLGQEKFPNQSIFNWQLGEVYLQQKAYHKALKAYLSLPFTGELPPNINRKSIDQRIGQCHSQIGTEYTHSKKWKKAVYHFQEANALLKHDLRFWVGPL